jgi:hypothetical protein
MRLRYNLMTNLLGATLADTDITITFASALQENGVDIPDIVAPDYLPLTIGGLEVVYLTAYTEGATTGDITREPPGEDTTALTHASGIAVQNNPTKLDYFPRVHEEAGAAPAYLLEDGSVIGGLAEGPGSMSWEAGEGAFAFGWTYTDDATGVALITASGTPSAAFGAAAAYDAGSNAELNALNWNSWVFGYAGAYDGGIAEVRATSGFAFGYAYGYGSGNKGSIEALIRGAFAGGYGGHGSIKATGAAAFAFGYCYKEPPATFNDVLIQASGKGSFAAGYLNAEGGATGGAILSQQPGAFALGFAYAYDTSSFAEVSTNGNGSFALGAAESFDGEQAMINTSGLGSLAGGYAKSDTTGPAEINSQSPASFAWGYAAPNETISAQAANAVQFGPGTNAEPLSLQVGSGIMILGGVPGTPANGMIWLDAGVVKVRSNGSTVSL